MERVGVQKYFPMLMVPSLIVIGSFCDTSVSAQLRSSMS